MCIALPVSLTPWSITMVRTMSSWGWAGPSTSVVVLLCFTFPNTSFSLHSSNIRTPQLNFIGYNTATAHSSDISMVPLIHYYRFWAWFLSLGALYIQQLYPLSVMGHQIQPFLRLTISRTLWCTFTLVDILHELSNATLFHCEIILRTLFGKMPNKWTRLGHLMFIRSLNDTHPA